MMWCRCVCIFCSFFFSQQHFMCSLSLSRPPFLPPSLPLPHSLSHSLTRSLTHSLSHSLSHSLTHSLPHSLTHSLSSPPLSDVLRGLVLSVPLFPSSPSHCHTLHTHPSHTLHPSQLVLELLCLYQREWRLSHSPPLTHTSSHLTDTQCEGVCVCL